MKKIANLQGLTIATLASFAAAFSACSPAPSGGAQERESVLFADAQLTVVDADEEGVASFIVGEMGEVRFGDEPGAEDVERLLYPFLDKASPLFRLRPEEMSLASVDTDGQGDVHLRFQQTRNGLEVLGGEIIVHLQGGVVTAVNGGARGDYDAPVEALIERKEAAAAAKRALDEVEHAKVSAEDLPLAYKVVEDRMELVYQIDVTGHQKDKTPVHDTVLVSARDGSIVGRIPHIHQAKKREMHDTNNSSTLPGPTVRTEGQSPLPSSTKNDPVNNNYDRLGTVWDCYKNLFNRDSYDNAGAKLVSTVHYQKNYVNAYWNGTQMVYGDGDGVNASNLANSMDVTAHELTHAVTEKTSKLVYEGESGGLNEAMSDIFGNTCEWYRDGQPATPSTNNWLVGEDVWTPGTSGDALRYMNDPKKDGVSLDYWTSTAKNADVHFSSGIANLAFYLLAQGGKHPRGKSTISVTGIGIAKAAQIFYKAQVGYFTSTSTFAAAKTATEQAAAALGYSASEVASVTAAWQAVGVGVTSGGTCAHDKCTTGSALSASCNSVVSAVCAADAACCSTTWNSKCVTENRTIGKSLKCSEANGSCSHNLCATGGKLTSGCDSAQANCVAAVCAADPYCCTTGWDSKCVGKVATVCGKNCN